jgi:acyl-[acyl carrier protein]--UDP-N-acetylglucosamine O-acyltransferase
MERIHRTAVISASAVIEDDVTIGASAVIHDGVRIDSGTWIDSH